MPLKTIHPTMQRALCWFEAFRRLGYPADDIFLVVGQDPHLGLALFTMVRANGKEFPCTAGPWDQDKSHVSRQWEEASTIWNHTTGAQHNQLFERVMQPGFSVPFITALTRKGVYPPVRVEKLHEGDSTANRMLDAVQTLAEAGPLPSITKPRKLGLYPPEESDAVPED